MVEHAERASATKHRPVQGQVLYRADHRRHPGGIMFGLGQPHGAQIVGKLRFDGIRFPAGLFEFFACGTVGRKGVVADALFCFQLTFVGLPVGGRMVVHAGFRLMLTFFWNAIGR
jgi:hypothetical protein